MKKLLFGFVFLIFIVLFLWLVSEHVALYLRARVAKDPAVAAAFLDVGQGDATFIEFPDKRQMLVDCGRDARVLEALGRVMRFYDRTIDYLVVTHPDSDHYAGCIDVLRRFNIRTIVYNGAPKSYDELWNVFRESLDQEVKAGALYEEITSARTVEIGGATIRYLYPDHPLSADPAIPGTNERADNNGSIVFRLTYGVGNILMTGDMEEPLENYLVRLSGESLDSEVLKAGHHGSGSSSSEVLVSAVAPRMAVVSAGKDNPYGHPSPRVVKRLERAGARVLRTDRDHDILLALTRDSVYVIRPKSPPAGAKAFSRFFSFPGLGIWRAIGRLDRL
ncbi:MAG: Metallo-beta-lactamase domain protein [Candidatus Magasanikbacteria bacterium GW2011_GWA2_56_11]|uniref:Metallo-beta-lactamase domain protein n=1 Tax=Candidatus Magasanikbacteria bacterium GW2011_GWA2_56_11 TaxID=1619044 RepID=A0A0G1YGV3_9BACT|nr:MAG: Metallo-beta-lactamase domain protein [Candidatus Magasanikbacteria bacterium GW2011_GWA2_56_11]